MARRRSPGQCSWSWKLLKSSSYLRPMACSSSCEPPIERSSNVEGERKPFNSCAGLCRPMRRPPTRPSSGSCDSRPSVHPNASEMRRTEMRSSEKDCISPPVKSSASHVCRQRSPLPSRSNRRRCSSSHRTESVCMAYAAANIIVMRWPCFSRVHCRYSRVKYTPPYTSIASSASVLIVIIPLSSAGRCELPLSSVMWYFIAGGCASYSSR
mmetsp:Transcript_15947/g.39989  ORF Transcript_15947/g.39989 Transcript_15947/m.39989 type:complete len:211 (-) Transcript_15947:480-1112(-)